VTGKLVAALVEQFPFIAGSVAADVGSAIDLGLARAHGTNKNVDAKLAASIARGILTRCRSGRVLPADIVTVILRKVAAGADLAMEEAAPEQLNKACPLCGARYTEENFLHLPLCGVTHSVDHLDCLETRTCTCGDSLSVEIPCDG
jgi:hypothetical protein